MNPNELPQDIQNAARDLANALLADPLAKAYQSAIADFDKDIKAAAVEKSFMDLYAGLIKCQHKGESFSQAEAQQFYAMRNQYYTHPLVVSRNNAMGAFKPLLADAAEQISMQIGLDFTELAKIE